MRKLFIISALFLVHSFAFAQNDSLNIECSKWLVLDAVESFQPAFNLEKDHNDEYYSTKKHLLFEHISITDISPKNGDIIKYKDQEKVWKINTLDSINAINFNNRNNYPKALAWSSSKIRATSFVNIDIKIESYHPIALYVDGEKKGSINLFQKEGKDAYELKVNLDLETGDHIIVVKSYYDEKKSNYKKWAFYPEIKVSKIENKEKLFTHNNDKKILDLSTLLSIEGISSFSISPDGKYYFVKEYVQNNSGSYKYQTKVFETKSDKLINDFSNSSPSQMKWMPQNHSLSYFTNSLYKQLISFNPETGERKILIENAEDISNYRISKDMSFMLYSEYEKGPKEEDVRLIEGPQNRSSSSGRSFIYYLDFESGIKERLTYGNMGTSIDAISPDGTQMIFSSSKADYNNRPYTITYTYIYNLIAHSYDTLWVDHRAPYIKFSPNGDKLMVLAAPSWQDNLGLNIPEDMIANDFDKQMYIVDWETKDISAASLNFDPNIKNVKWIDDNNLLLLVEKRDFKKLYTYNLKNNEYKEIETPGDVVLSFSLSETSKVLYSEHSINSPSTLWKYDLNKNKSDKLWEADISDIQLGDTEEFNFLNQRGDSIYGRVYYPPNYDANKKYPMIVYYYGGTNPVSRNFGGRYPKNLFAANGYIVYVVQPSGATGFGQKFSAEHVNSWGLRGADDIINGTKMLYRTHTNIDSTNIGCIGASYGGFMTMYLITQTDIFSAAISHAGISSISSYWGEGYWGYSYSSYATAEQFPWNNKELYIQQSPLFLADKINTPLLLLHGTSDTNVPPGESYQMFTALKLLNKDVNLVEIDGENHHITDYKKRIKWQKTILAYFDKQLKNENEWWDSIY